MAGEEGLIVPAFGIDPEYDRQVLPDLCSSGQPERPTAPAAPAKPENPGLGFMGNLFGSFRSGTITGALAEAETQRLARGGTPTQDELIGDPVGAGMEGLIAPEPELTVERADAIRRTARDQVLEQIAYDLAPTHVSASGIAGSIVGQLADPLNLATFGGGAVATRLGMKGYGAAAQAAGSMAVQAGVTDAAVQSIRTASGAEEKLDPVRAAVAPVAGAALGAGLHVGGQAIGKAAGSVAEFVRTRAAQREALGTDLPREALAGGAVPEVQPAAVTMPAARTDLPAPPLREAEPAPRMPAAEPDATAPVSREQVDGRAEPAPAGQAQPANAPSPIPERGVDAPSTPQRQPAETFEDGAARLSAEREAMQASGADAAPETRDLYEALGSAGGDRNADPAWSARHVDEALRLGRRDIADHIVESAERRAVEAERIASDAVVAETERDTPGTRYAAAVAIEDAQRARSAADAARKQREGVTPAAGRSDGVLPEPMSGERFTEYAARVRKTADEQTAWEAWNGFKIAELRARGAGNGGDGPNAAVDPVPAQAPTAAGRGESSEGISGTARAGEAPAAPSGRTAPRTAGLGEIERDGVFFKDTRGQGVQYHGTSTPDLVPDDGHYSTLNYYGQGFYTTDAADVAFGYSKRGSKQTGERNIYTVRENRPLKIYDAEQPITGDVLERLGPGDGGSKLGDIVDMAFDENPKNIRELYDHIRDIGTSEGLPADEVQEIFDAINWNLRKLGYDGMSHLGGLRTKTKPHGVTIYFAPQDDITITKGGFEAFHAPEPKPAAPAVVADPDAAAARAAADVPVREEPTPAIVEEAPPVRGVDTPSPPALSASTKANWTELRPAAAADAPAWAPRIQSTLEELARGFGIEPPQVSVGKPRFPEEEPLFGVNDRRGNIVLSETMGEHHAVNNAMHEFGHEVQFRLYDAAPQETRDAIQEAFRAATKRDYGNTSLNQLRPVTATQKLGEAGQPKRIKTPRTGDEPIPPGSAANYQHSFEEWFAEQVSRWATTDARPTSVVERFFAGVADAWRRIYERVVGHTPLASEMRAFLEGRWRGAEEGRLIRQLPQEGGRRPTLSADEGAPLQRSGRGSGSIDDSEGPRTGLIGLLTTPENRLVEAATRLHGAPAERTVPIAALRAEAPDVPAAQFDLALAAMRERGVIQISDRGVRLDPAAVREVHAAAERHVSREAESIGRELFGEAPEVMQRRRVPAAQIVEEPDQIRQGRPVEDQGTAPVDGDARPARLEEIAQGLARDFETVLRSGRVQPGARGQFNTSTGVARVRSLSDLDTSLHEIGHSLQQSPQTARLVDPVIARNRFELAPLGAGTGKEGDAEAFAELFRLYATNRAYASRTYPNATADLERTLAADLPAQAAALDRLRGDLDTIHRADSGAVVGSDVITPAPAGIFRRMLDLFGADFIGAAAVDPRGGVFYGWRDALYTHMLSPHHPINRSMDALARVYRDNTGKTLDLLPQDSPYILARVGSGARAVADSFLTHGVRGARSDEAAGASFRDAVEAAIGKRYKPEQWHDFGAYLTARRMVAEYERFAAGEIPNPPGRLSAGDYAKAVQEFEAKYPTFADGAGKLYEFQRNLLQRHFDHGLFTKDYYDAAMARRDYVPALRDMEDLGTAPMSGGGARRDGASMMKAFRGSQRSVMNPLDSIVKRVHDLEQAAALNETKAALARLAEVAGPGSGFIAERIPANKLSSVRVDVVDALRAAGSRANVDNLDLGALIHQAEGLLGDDVFAHIFRQEPIRPGFEPITFYFVNGERRALRLADGPFGRELYNALNVMTQPERNVFLSVLQISGQLLRSGVTKSIGFVYRNFTRDQGTSVGTGARGYIPFVSALKGAFDAARGGGDFERYLSFGGFAGGAIMETMENSALARGGAQRMFREKNPVSRVLGASAKLAEFSEAATRAGQFQSYTKQARDLGFDPFNSALFATYKANDYMDFRKVGSGVAAAARLVPFLNASAQGTDREARALFGDMVRLETKRARGEELSRLEQDTLKDARTAWVKTLAWGMLLGGGTAYLNSDNPEWFGAPEWRRARGYNLIPLGPEGNWLTAFKPFGFVRNISDMFEYGVEYLMRGDPRLAGKLGRALAEAHHLPYSNPFVDVFYNTRANYDPFRQRSIVSPSLQSLPETEQYTRYTSEVAKGIGQVTGWSPMKVDYAVKNLGGTIAQDFLANSTTLIKWMQGQPGGKEKTIWDLPLMRELTQNLTVGADATERFYKLVGDKVGGLEQFANAQAQKIKAGDRTGAADYLRRGTDAERAYATLRNLGFDQDEKLMHPLVLARAYNRVVSDVSRAVGDRNLLAEADLDRKHLTLSRRDATPIQISGPTVEKLRNELDALSMVTARNALIAYGAEGMQGVPVKDPAEFLDRIRMLSPEVARELRGRLAAKRLYDPGVVAERWPEVRARLLKDGEDADLTDLLPRRPKSAQRERKRALREYADE